MSDPSTRTDTTGSPDATERVGVWRSFWNYFWRKDDEGTPDAERSVEAGWVPAWQAQMITDELVASNIPAVMTEDFNLNLLLHSKEPMSRIFVTADRLDEATEIITEILGHEPRHRSL
ncbi:MAG: hypothetical protein AB8G26_12550 [Ilumatobacter sp.]